MKMKMKIAIAVLLGVVMPGMVILGAALSDFARWGGYAQAVPLMILFVLFLMGNFIITSRVPRRRISR